MTVFKKISELSESTELGFVIATVGGVSKKFNLDNLGKKTQYETLPSASENAGKIFQYVGETNENYTNGMFYVSLENGQGQYEWFPSSIMQKVDNATTGDIATLDENGNVTDSGKKLSDFKLKQTAVPSPTASGNARSFIDSISQDENGVMTVTKKTLLNALMGSGYGICNTAAATTDKTATMSDYEKVSGGFVVILFDNDVPANSTLNINNKGAADIRYKGTNITSGIIKAGDRALFVMSTTSSYTLITTDRIAKESITSLSISGQTITITKADGTTSTITTQDTKNTAGSTDTSSKIYLVGATSQAANPQTYSDNEVYVQNGLLEAKEVRVNEAAKLVWDSTNQCMRITFN